jgi:hypothetical protein
MAELRAKGLELLHNVLDGVLFSRWQQLELHDRFVDEEGAPRHPGTL